MTQFNFNPYIYQEVERRHDELMKQAAQDHLFKEAFKVENPRSKTLGNIFALVGKELSKVGFSLEVRYGGQPDLPPTLNQQSNPNGCQ